MVPFDDFVNVNFKDTPRDASGKYKVVIENDSGTCDAVFNVKVQGNIILLIIIIISTLKSKEIFINQKSHAIDKEKISCNGFD